MAEGGRTLIADLENASKEHEKEVVIELGTDRLIRWLGVYVLAFLAVVAKIGELAATSLSCYPANTTSDPNGAFIQFATDYCWTSTVQGDATSSPSCRSLEGDQQILLDNANNLKLFLQWLPYVMLAQAFLFSLPVAYWHFRVGARLVGHLKFMQLLLIEIFEQVKKIKCGGYDEKPYDASGSILDGRKAYEPQTEKKMVPIPAPSAAPNPVLRPSNATGQISEGSPLVRRSLTQPAQSSQVSVENGNPVSQTPNKAKTKTIDWILAGQMKDRHFFSMLCFENFASLHHLPYILSVFRVSEYIPDEDEEEGDAERDLSNIPLLESMLLIWCDPKNLADVFLLRVYARKQLSIAFLSLAMLLALLAWFFADVMYDVMLSDTFWCEIPYQSVCMLCSIKRVKDTVMLFTIDVTITLIVFALAVWKWLDVRGSFGREAAHFFDVLQETSNVAFDVSKFE